MNSDDDETLLLERALGGDQEAFLELLKRSDAVLRSVTFAVLGNADDMDDVLQEASIKALRSLSSFAGKSSFSSWMYRIAYNTAIDHLRKVRRLQPMDIGGLGQMTWPVASEEDAVDTRRDLQAALNLISAEQRAAVWLVDVNGIDYAAASVVLGIPEGTVASRLSAARKSLRSLLAIKEEGSTR